MKYLVTGGSGFLGINLIRFLHAKGHQIRSLDLVDFDYPDMNDKIEAIKGDIRDKETVKKAVEGVRYSCSLCSGTSTLHSRRNFFDRY